MRCVSGLQAESISRADSLSSVQEIKELQRENNPDMMAEALEVSPPVLLCPLSRATYLVQCPHQLVVQDNIFEWHFAIRGPPDSEFQVCGTYCLIKILFALQCCTFIKYCLPAGRDLSRQDPPATRLSLQAPLFHAPHPQRQV